MDGFSEMLAECNTGPLVMGNLPTEEIFYWEFEMDENGQFKPDKDGVIIYANINNTTLKYIYFDPNREGLRVLTPYKAIYSDRTITPADCVDSELITTIDGTRFIKQFGVFRSEYKGDKFILTPNSPSGEPLEMWQTVNGAKLIPKGIHPLSKQFNP